MKLSNELLSILDNKNESFSNRLKLADNIIRIPEKLLEDEETIIFSWILHHLNHECPETWNVLLSWLTTKQFNCVFNTNSDIWNHLVQAILTNIQGVNGEFKKTLLSISLIILESNIPQSFIKANINDYCCFLFTTINEIDDPISLAKFLNKDVLYSKKIITNETFILYLIKNGMSILIRVRKKFDGNRDVHRSISAFIEKGIFQHGKKDFDIYYSKLFENREYSEKTLFPELLLDQLKTAINKNEIDTQIMFEIIFESYNHCHRKDFGSIYKFSISILEILGFSQKLFFESNVDLENLNSICTKTLNILVTLFRLLSSNNIDLNYQVKGLTFESFLEDFMVSLITKVKHPSEEIYDIFVYLSSITPLSIERKLDILLPYFLLTTKHNEKYPQLFNIFTDIFAKLHRLQTFVSKMVKLMKGHLCNFNKTDCIYNVEAINVDSMFPKSVQDNFTNCIAALASWQVMNIFKTLIFHLKEIDDNLQTLGNEFRYVLYVEIISMLTCLLLSTTRIAEHTVSETIVENFICGMKELEDIVKSFGISLVKREHNPRLMYAYLNICYNWADLSILMKYHLNRKEMHFNLTINGDITGYNITYTHPYLTRDQWCLIAERITNFGEAPCKKIMHKLLIQKLKALFIFEKNVYDEVQTSIVRIVNQNIDSIWEDLLSDHFALKHICPKMDETALLELSEIIFKESLKTKSTFLKRNVEILNCGTLISAILYTNLSKISGLFKSKRKHGETSIKQMRTYAFFCNVPSDFILSDATAANEFDSVLNDFISTINLKQFSAKDDFNEKRFTEYLEIFEKLPVLFLSKEIETTLLMYFTIMLLDLKLLKSAASQNCERIIIGFIRNEKILFDRLPNMDFILQIILNFFDSYEEAFGLLCLNVLRDFDKNKPLELKSKYRLLEGIKDFLLPNIREQKYLQLAVIFIKQINKFRKLKISQDRKNEIDNLQSQVLFDCAKLCLDEMDLFIQPHFIECYNLVLKHALDKKDDSIIPQLTSKLEGCINGICAAEKRTNVQECVKLFITIFHYKNKINVSDIASKTWNFCKTVDNSKSEWEDFSKLIVLLFEHMSNDEFLEASQELLQIIIDEFHKNETKGTNLLLKKCSSVLSCNFNSTKTQIWQSTLEKLFRFLLAYVRMSESSDLILNSLIEVELNLIKSVQFYISSSLMDYISVTVSLFMEKSDTNFTEVFILNSTILEYLLKFRKVLIMDRLPSFLQLYRILLSKLCFKSNVELHINTNEVAKLSGCALKLERITTKLGSNGKYIARISPYLIADILNEYERVTLFPDVKFHLNNCLYQLMPLCDHHAVSYCLRILSPSSAELFKVVYGNYKKFYKFMGKV